MRAAHAIVPPQIQDQEPDWAEPARAISAAPARPIGDGAGEPSAAAVIGWTIAVLALAAAAAALMRRLLRRSGLLADAGPIRVVARRALAPRHDLFLVEVGPRAFLIGATRDRLVTLGEFASAGDVRGQPAPETDFRAALRERLRAPDPGAAAAEPRRRDAGPGPYEQIAGELAEIRSKVDGWRTA